MSVKWGYQTSPRIVVEIKGECECENVHLIQCLARLKYLIKAEVLAFDFVSHLRFLLFIKIVAGTFKVKVLKPLKGGGLPNSSPLHDFRSASTASLSFLIETGWRCPTLGSAAASNLSAQALLSVRAHGPSFCWVYLDPPPLISFTFGHSPRPFGFFHLICSTS